MATKIHPVNVGDVEDSLIFKEMTKRPNAKFAWTGNVGVIIKDAHESCPQAALRELEESLSLFFGDKIKIVQG